MDQHTRGQWLIHGTKRRKDNQLQSLDDDDDDEDDDDDDDDDDDGGGCGGGGGGSGDVDGTPDVWDDDNGDVRWWRQSSYRWWYQIKLKSYDELFTIVVKYRLNLINLIIGHTSLAVEVAGDVMNSMMI